MVQFQIGLELTNIVNPLTQAISALGSLALVDAIKKSGSDVITEMRLASLIGRHRIDEVIDFHFREVVAKADKTFISRYVDIMLESGSGPTVQEALKNPALFSMVVQLSALCFSHEHQSLASAMVEAFERIVREAGKETESIPDYVSLLGTLRACQQQTSAFQWGPLYESVEYKIEASIESPDPGMPDKDHRKPKISTRDFDLFLLRVKERNLPFVVLQSLLMWLHSLQNFPEHRVLHLYCDTGISTVIVWCHHVLGLGVVVRFGENEITFGKEPRNLMIEGCEPSAVEAMLMDPADKYEPLFTLTSDDNDNRISREHRSQAYGFCLKLLEQANATRDEIHYCSHWITARALAMLRFPHPTSKAEGFDVHIVTDNTSSSNSESSDNWSLALAEGDVIRAGQFLFVSLESHELEKHVDRPPSDTLSMLMINWRALVALLLSFARIQAHDLEKCQNLPLSLDVYRKSGDMEHGIYLSMRDNFSQGPLDLIESFTFLSRLLLGSMFSKEYVDRSVLVSAWGWSIFFNSVDALDPADVSITSMRVLCGVPSRRGLRRARIIDGPLDLYSSKTFSGENRRIEPEVRLNPGVSTAKKGSVLIGHHSDAFSITQSYDWEYIDRNENSESIYRRIKKQKLGFRMMQEICLYANRIPQCDCQEISDPLEWLNEHICDPGHDSSEQGTERNDKDHNYAPNGELDQPAADQMVKICKCHWPKASKETKERVIEVVYKSKTASPFEDDASGSEKINAEVKADSIWLIFVSDNAAARWLQLNVLCDTQRNSRLGITKEAPFLYLRGRDTCVRCATDYVGLNRLLPKIPKILLL